MSNATITIRKATVRDAADLAIADNLASHGMSLKFWRHAVETGEAKDALEFARERFASAESIYGWANAMVAETEDGTIAGSATAYVMPEPDDEAEEIKRLFPDFVPVFELFADAVDDWFIDSIAVFTPWRGQGVASKLLDAALETGKQTGAKRASLVVEANNDAGMRLYRRKGFEIRASRPFAGETAAGSENKWLLISMKI